jgi:hypothetical protein
MHVFRLFEQDNIPDGDFRWRYNDIEDRVARCCTLSADDILCQNDCNYLIAFDVEATRDGYPAVFGINCDVEVLCWGGHSDETTVDVHCFECAVRRKEHERAMRTEDNRRSSLRTAQRQHEESLRLISQRTTAEHWQQLPPLPFETECAHVFRHIGFLASMTARTNDRNIDIALEKEGRRGAAQCKAWSKPCGVRIVREFLGTIYAENFEFGYLVARSGFTARATDLLRRFPMIEAWDLQKLVAVSRTLHL